MFHATYNWGESPPPVSLVSSVGGLVGKWLGHKGKMLRTTTLMGMACGFAAFFGAPLGGSMFALEVLHRVGMEYYESATYAVLAGTLCW
jgi:H+/Cl- antiporter ClcA